MGLITVERTINAPVDRVYAIAKDIERLPDVVPDLTEVRIVERVGARIVSTWRGTVNIAGLISRPLYWKESSEWDDERKLCTFSLIEGDMKKYSGDWSFTPVNGDTGSTLVKLNVDFELGVPMLGPLIIKLIDKLMKENCEALLEGIANLAKASPTSTL